MEGSEENSDEYFKKLEHLQSYKPFLRSMINQLKDPAKKNREQQVTKLESLYSMISNKNKKLKIETLNKCEDVITKLYLKVNYKGDQDQAVENVSNSPQFTPASPSPPREIVPSKPITIPTERLSTDSRIEKIGSSPVITKIDVYSSAAESLKLKPSTVVSFQPAVKKPDSSKPPISLDDLKELEEDVHEKIAGSASLIELNNLRKKIADQIMSLSPMSSSPDEFSSPMARLELDKSSTHKAKTVSVSSKIVKPYIVKEASNFGNILSNIDEQIIDSHRKKEDKKGKEEKKHKEKRSGDEKKKDHKHDKKKKHEDKEKKKHEDKDKKKHEDKEKKHKDDKDGKQKKEGKHEDNSLSNDLLKLMHKTQNLNNVNKPENSSTENKSDSKLETPNLEANEKKEDSATDIKDGDPQPLYKRLADKYNPKPKKPQLDADKSLSDSIEAKMMTSPPPLVSSLNKVIPSGSSFEAKTKPLKIPFLDQTAPSTSVTEAKTHIPPQIPLLNKVTASNTEVIVKSPPPQVPVPKILPPPPAPPRKDPELPPILQTILNPNASQLINDVVNHLRQSNSENERNQQVSMQLSPPVHQNQNLISPTDNFISDYARESNPPPRFDPRPQEPSMKFPQMPQNSNFPPQMYGQPSMYNNFNHNFNQMDNMHTLDYYPPNAPVPPNQFCGGPPLLSPEIPHFNEHKQNFMVPNHDMFQHNEDRRWDNRQWNRGGFERHYNRGPTTYREYREMKERDPRLARPENRDPRQRPQVERESRDPRECRDPRLNRNLDRAKSRDRSGDMDRQRDKSVDMNKARECEDRGRSREQSGERFGNKPMERGRSRAKSTDYRYDKFDQIYSRSNYNSNSKCEKTFTSPLYPQNEEKTAKVQNFRIPKVKKDDPINGNKEHVETVELRDDETITLESPEKNMKKKDDEKETENISKQGPAESEHGIKSSVAISPTTKEISKEDKSTTDDERSNKNPPDLSNASEGVTIDSKINFEAPKLTIASNEPDEQKPSTSKISESDISSRPPLEQAIFAQFFANLMSSHDKKEKKSAICSLISTFADSFSPKELSKITKIIKADGDSDSENEEDTRVDQKEDKREVKEAEKEPRPETPTPESEDEEIITKSKARRRIRRLSSASPIKEQTSSTPTIEDSPEDPENLNDVVVTVGERIKSRKRASNRSSKSKKRTELDKLHEDIQEMFMRDGVLTATGKRMCRLLKQDPALLSPPEDSSVDDINTTPPKKKPGSKLKETNADINNLKDMRVILSKLPDSKFESKVSRRLTRSMTGVSEENNTAPSLDAWSDEEDSKKEDSDVESSDSDKDTTASQVNETPQKPKGVKRKRGNRWASGIIDKKKRKDKSQVSETNTVEEKSSEERGEEPFLEPNKNYYIDLCTQKSYDCKLCPYQGKFITIHYKREHPDSEVLCSRLSPENALDAIKDSEENLAKYEKYYNKMKASMKLLIACRFCAMKNEILATMFYDHVSSHTGEYRHLCPCCTFSTCCAKTLKSHINQNHKDYGKTIYRDTYNNTIIFGYLCGACNYVQMHRKHVEEHVNIYHLQETTIYKIHMSRVFDPRIEQTYQLEMGTATASEESKQQEESDVTHTNDAEDIDVLPCDTKEKGEVIPKRKRQKPGPKSKKTLLINKPDTQKQPVGRRRKSVVLEETDILPIRSQRAAKEKAQEKLKSLAEMSSDYLSNKSDLNELNKSPEASEVASGTTDVEKPSSDDSSDAQSEVNDINNASEQMEDVCTRSEIIKSVKQEVDLNVFTCNTDLFEENKKIHQERLQKMEELNKSVGNRTSLHFVDALCNRLNQNGVLVKQEPIDEVTESLFRNSELNNSPRAMPVLEKNVSPETQPETENQPVLPSPAIHKRPVMETDESQILPTTNFDVTQKNDKTIMNMIEKLKGKLAHKDSNAGDHPPLIHVKELVNAEPMVNLVTIQELGNLIKLIKTENSVTFCCLIPSCTFSTDIQDSFHWHCKVAHKPEVIGYLMTLCEICGSILKATLTANLLENLFQHLVTDHCDLIKIEAKLEIKPIKEIATPSPVLRIRKLSGDALSITREQDEDGSVHNESVEGTTLEDVNSNVTPPEGEPTDPIASEGEVSDVAPVNTSDVAPETSSMISQPNTTSSEVVPSGASPAPEVQEDDSEYINPFSFKIAEVMSLAEPLQQPPPLTLIAKDLVPSTRQIRVKEVKLKPHELQQPRKCPKAMESFVKNPWELYKCPHFFCMFITNAKDNMDRHLKTHNSDPEALLPCVYCDVKTPWEHVSLHIDLRHSLCKFLCGHCLYRSLLKDYVFLHHQLDHKKKERIVYNIPGPGSTQYTLVEKKPDVRQLCTPFQCTHFCGQRFILANEFKEHLIDAHSQISFIKCGHENCNIRLPVKKVLSHWNTVHGIGVYQCGYCRASCGKLKAMCAHLAMYHANHDVCIYARVLPETLRSNETLGYRDEVYKKVRKINTFPSSDEFNADVINPAEVPPFMPVKVGLTVKVESTMHGSPVKVSTAAYSVLKHKTAASNVMVSSPGVITADNAINTVSTLPVQQVVTPTTSILTPVVTLKQPEVISINDSISENMDSSKSMEEPAIKEDEVPLEQVFLSNNNVPPTVQQEERTDSDLDPLALDINEPQDNAASSEDESDCLKDKKKKIGLLSFQLFRCAFCTYSSSNSVGFKKHVNQSVNCKSKDTIAKPFMCVHCKKKLRHPNALADHIQSHGILRVTCSLCEVKFPTPNQARTHMKARHNVNQTTLTPLIPSKNNIDIDELIVKPKLVSVNKQLAKDSPSSEPTASNFLIDNIYMPDEIVKIPRSSIFSTASKCGLCSYSTKVRTNLVRHLQFHSQEISVPTTAPVNPVPCLVKNEKMFDKMINLASSSHTGRMGGPSKEKEKDEFVPEFVPTHSRYACCAEGCQYICPEEGNLRHHLSALHDGETSFTCVHCKANLVPGDADCILKHFKLHGLQLYKCHYCNFVHNQKHKVEKHVSDAHLDVPLKVITVRHLESDPSTAESSVTTPQPPGQSRWNRPWRCCMCKTRSQSQEGIKAHVLEKHEMDQQFKCALCSYKTNDIETFKDHFKDAHPSQEVDIIHIYRKIEENQKEVKDIEAFDTTPLWQRDRPRVRHIRGILFEDIPSTPAKIQKKMTKVTATSPVANVTTKAVNESPKATNMELSIESVVNGTADILKLKQTELITKVVKQSGGTIEETNTTEDSSIIVIDSDTPDENEDEETDKLQSPNKGVKRKSSLKIETVRKLRKLNFDIYGESKKLDSKDQLQEANLCALYGDYGSPSNKQFCCPKCQAFKSKKISDFIFHMFKEMEVYRFKCLICANESVTYRYMYNHVKKHDTNDIDKNIIALPMPQTLEVWLQRLLQNQSSMITRNYVLCQGQTKILPGKIQCHICLRSFATESDRNEHAIVHWARVPYACKHCEVLFFMRSALEDHLRNMHPYASTEILVRAPMVSQELERSDQFCKRQLMEHDGKIAQTTIPDTVKPELESSPEKAEVLESDEMLQVDLPESESVVISDNKTEGDLQAPENPAVDSDVDEQEGSTNNFEFNDLLIVSKTDTKNVPKDGDVFCCTHCPYYASSEMTVLSHYSNDHENTPAKIKVLNQLASVEEYGCMHCSMTGSEIAVRKHHIDSHDEELFQMYRYTCSYCDKKYQNLFGLKLHTSRNHSGKTLKYSEVSHVPTETPPEEKKPIVAEKKTREPVTRSLEIKRYSCTLCKLYERNFPQSGFSKVKQHIKTHFKAYSCGECHHRFKTRVEVIHHYKKEHIFAPREILHNQEIENQYQQTVKDVQSQALVIGVSSEIKHTARKSTSAKSKPIEEYSFYGTPIEEDDLTKIMTTVEMNGKCLNMSADKLKKIFDLDPILMVVDCEKKADVSKETVGLES